MERWGADSLDYDMAREVRGAGSRSPDALLAIVSRLLIVAAVIVPLLALLPDLIYLTPDVNDGAFHLGTVRNTIAASREGANPIDFWVPTWLCGFPLFHYYQPGPYLLVTAAHALVGGLVPLLVLYRAITLMVVCAFPFATYLGLRRLDLDRATAASGAFLSGLVSGAGTYGIEPFSFTWAGWGLFAQAVALPLLPLALAEGWRGVGSRGRTIGHALVLVGAFLAHILYGYIAAVSLGLAPFMVCGLPAMRRRLLGLARFYAQAGALLAFFVVPLALNSAYHAKSLYDSADKFDSYGAGVILTRLLTGSLLDNGRLPVLTVLAAVGLYRCLRRWTDEGSAIHGWIACSFVLWTLLYFGRPTWGALMNLLPLSNGLHLERLSNGVQLFAVWLAAVALGDLLRWWASLEGHAAPIVVGAVLAVVIVTPIAIERGRYLRSNADIVRAGYRSYVAEVDDFAPVMARLQAEPGGRVYAGHSADWGKNNRIGSVPAYQLLSAAAIPTNGNAPFSWPLPTDFQYQFGPLDGRSYDLYDVRYVLTDQNWLQPPNGTLLAQSGKRRLYRVPTSGPFALVSVPLSVIGDKETTWYLDKSWTKGSWPGQRAHVQLVLRDGEPHHASTVLRMIDAFRYVSADAPDAEPLHVFDAPGPLAAAPPRPPRGKVFVVAESRQEAAATVDLPERAVLMFKTTYHPNWRAAVDGVAVPTMLLTPGFIGIEVPAGQHYVRIEYRSGVLKAILLVLGIVVAVGLDWWRRWGSVVRLRGLTAAPLTTNG